MVGAYHSQTFIRVSQWFLQSCPLVNFLSLQKAVVLYVIEVPSYYWHVTRVAFVDVVSYPAGTLSEKR